MVLLRRSMSVLNQIATFEASTQVWRCCTFMTATSFGDDTSSMSSANFASPFITLILAAVKAIGGSELLCINEDRTPKVIYARACQNLWALIIRDCVVEIGTLSPSNCDSSSFDSDFSSQVKQLNKTL
uniref:Uncharacterized protein n=1 Tax=Glossina austeni TaxID=7395 RepID=A0A1A9V026_GLOAU